LDATQDAAPHSGLLSFAAFPAFGAVATMLELNPIRQRIADLQGRLLSLRGFL
jgi:hypothetical protein